MYDEKPKPWSTQNNLKERHEIPDPIEIRDNILSIYNERNRALIAVMYISAARIGEIVNNKHHKGRPGITIDNVNMKVLDGQEFLLLRFRNEKAKNKDKQWKDIPISMSDEIDGPLARCFIDYANSVNHDAIFNITTARAWNIMKKELGYNCHWMRHIRITHLVHRKNYNQAHLIHVAGWSDNRPADKYTMTSWEDVARRDTINKL